MTTHSFSLQPETKPEPLAPFLVRQWHRLGPFRCLCLTIRKMDRATLTLWADTIIEALEATPSGHFLFLINDFSDRGTALTPYLRRQVVRLLNYRNDTVSWVANVLPRTFILQVVIQFLRTVHDPMTHIRNCFTLEDAQRWIETEASKQVAKLSTSASDDMPLT